VANDLFSEEEEEGGGGGGGGGGGEEKEAIESRKITEKKFYSLCPFTSVSCSMTETRINNKKKMKEILFQRKESE